MGKRPGRRVRHEVKVMVSMRMGCVSLLGEHAGSGRRKGRVRTVQSSRTGRGELETDGWDVSYLGANTPHADIISMLKERNARALLVSVTMGYNVKRVSALIHLSAPNPGWRT
jgi:hypothetical protein